MSEENVKRIIDLTEQGIQSLSDKLGVALPHLWEVLVRQQYAEAITNIVLITIGSVLLILLWRKVYKMKGDFVGDWGDFTARGFLALLGLFVSIVATFVFPIMLSESIPKLINPEYYAIQDIMNFVNGK